MTYVYLITEEMDPVVFLITTYNHAVLCNIEIGFVSVSVCRGMMEVQGNQIVMFL